VGGACGTHGRGEKRVEGFDRKARRKRPLGRPRRRWEDGIKWTFGRLVGGCGVDSPGSGYGFLAGFCERGDEPSGPGTTELVSSACAHGKKEGVNSVTYISNTKIHYDEFFTGP
jgi:hypothetical protein